MTKFTQNIEKELPYNRSKYINFLSNESSLSTKWYGVSFQLLGGFGGKKIEATEYVEKYEPWFKNIVSKLDNGLFWTVNHDDKDMAWFPNEKSTVISLRTLFKENDIPDTFTGAVMLTKNDLLKFSKDLISYPFALLGEEDSLYKNLDISHGELQFIIKISGHMNIDLLSTDEALLREIATENSSSFILKEYQVLH
jgi:hypothetical protein